MKPIFTYNLILLLLSSLTNIADAQVSFVRQVAPILNGRCIGCHGERTNLGRYRAQTFQNLMKSGTSGKAAIVAGKPEKSKLYQLVSSHSLSDRMPKGDDPLPKQQIQLIRSWIAEGAKFDGADPTAPLKSLFGHRVHPASPGPSHRRTAET